MSDSPPKPQPPRSRKRFQFGVWVWFLAAFLVSAALAPVAGLMRAGRPTPLVRDRFSLLLLAATPVAVLLIVSLLRAVTRRDKDGGAKHGGNGD